MQFEDKNDFDFFKNTMPPTRNADYYLGCLGGCVFIDFNNNKNNLIELKRISFDGYGCCELKDSKSLGKEDSKKFREILNEDIDDQAELKDIVFRAIHINQHSIWRQALIKYRLI